MVVQLELNAGNFHSPFNTPFVCFGKSWSKGSCVENTRRASAIGMLTKFLNNVLDQEFQAKSGVYRVFDFTIERGNVIL